MERKKEEISPSKQAIQMKLDTTVVHFYMTLTVTLKTCIWLDQLVLFVISFFLSSSCLFFYIRFSLFQLNSQAIMGGTNRPRGTFYYYLQNIH